MARSAWRGAVMAAVGLACGHEAALVPAAPSAIGRVGAPPIGAPPETSRGVVVPPQYVAADPRVKGWPGAPVALDKGDLGLVVDGVRVVVGRAGTRVARDVADPALLGGVAVPASLGGGFVFHAGGGALYRAAHWDDPLAPLVGYGGAGEIDALAFAAGRVFVHTASGERALVDLATRARAPALPLGVAAIASVTSVAPVASAAPAGDATLVALTSFGTASVSVDRGATWADVTPRLRAPPERLVARDDAVWIVESGHGASRVDAGGALTAFDRLPDPPPPVLRPRDARWRADDPPLLRAIRSGAMLDERTAVVADGGVVYQVDVVTGEIVRATVGQLPDAPCDAIRAGDDVILACMSKAGQGYVASHLFAEKGPTVEQHFGAVATITVGDDGALAYAGPCSGARASAYVACVRATSGAWTEYDLENVAVPTGAKLDPIARWIPRADGDVIGLAFATSPAPGGAGAGVMIDARTQAVHPLSARIPLSGPTRTKRGAYRFDRVDRAWTALPTGALRGWTGAYQAGASIDVAPDGTVTPSTYAYVALAPAGAAALAVAVDGRFWQSTDRGASWTEVQGPPTVTAGRGAGLDPTGCSTVGCDLRAWYRVGWAALPPGGVEPPQTVDPPPRLAAPPPALLSCRAAGEMRGASAARTERSPDDLGLGAVRAVVSATANALTVATPHAFPSPIRVADEIDASASAPRLVVHGLATENDDDGRLVVAGAVHDPMSLRRDFAFLAAFDPAAPIRRATIGVADLVAPARAVGISRREIVDVDLLVPSASVPITPVDPAAPADLLVDAAGGLVVQLRAQAARGAYRPFFRGPTEVRPVVSAVALAGDDVAALVLGSEGTGAVGRFGGGTFARLFDAPPLPSADLYPANVDALAVGPRGELALLRTPSGDDPPSALDPAILYVPGASPVALAPWSTLDVEGGAACRAEAGGYRATVQARAPWIRAVGDDVRPADAGPMIARVRWTASRVCLEAVELPLRPIDLREVVAASGDAASGGRPAPTSTTDAAVETWLVARFAGTAAAARVAVTQGAEFRQPLTCTFGPP